MFFMAILFFPAFNASLFFTGVKPLYSIIKCSTEIFYDWRMLILCFGFMSFSFLNVHVILLTIIKSFLIKKTKVVNFATDITIQLTLIFLRRFCVQYAYIRVSSADQNTARQEEALSKAGFQPDKICVEHASAKDTNRPGLQELLGQLRPGDTLLVHSIDRLCRNMSDMCAVTTRLRDQGVTLIFLKEQLTFSAGTNNPMQELQLHMMSAFSQFERALLKERQADGIAAKKARGEKTGRPGADIKKIQEIDALRSRGVRLRIACDHAGLGVSTYYKLRHQMNNQ